MSQAAQGPFVPVVIDWTEFNAMARAAFLTVKRAMSRREAAICRHVMTEEAWQHTRAEVDVLRLDGCINLQSGLDITDITPGDRDVVGTIDRVTVRLLVSGVDCVVNEATHALVSGSRERGDHLEDWTFERSRDPDVLRASAAPRCPACGAPLTLDEVGQCSFCHAVVPGAKSDWLVSAIGHPSQAAVDPLMNAQAAMEAGKVAVEALAAEAANHAWTGSDPAPVPVAAGAQAGVAAIRAHDPAFNPSDLVVEAREVFFKLEEARNLLRPAGIRPLLSDALYAAESARAATTAASGRKEVRAYLEIADVSFVAAGSTGGRDQLVARVSASSARTVVDLATGELLEGSAVTHAWAEDLVFERAATAASDALGGLLAHRCPACGQPAQVSEDGRCVFCSEHVTGGERDWILAEVRPPA